MFAFNRFFDAFRAVVVVALPIVPLVCISIWGPGSTVLSNVVIAISVAGVMVGFVLLASAVQRYFRSLAVSAVTDKVTSAGHFVARLDKRSYRRLRPVWAPKLMMVQAAAPLVFVSTDVDLQLWIMSPERLMLSIPWWAVQSLSLSRGRLRSPRIAITGTDPSDPLLPLTVIASHGQGRSLVEAIETFAVRAGARA